MTVVRSADVDRPWVCEECDGRIEGHRVTREKPRKNRSPQRRIATADYFVARTGLDGDHKVCMLKIGRDGKLSLDRSFRDELTGQTCVSFNRKNWPHGAFGNAKPHSMLFVAADDDTK